MPSTESDAAIQADHLITLLIQNQPSLFACGANGVFDTTGKNCGEAIAALRLKLIEMYKTQP